MDRYRDELDGMYPVRMVSGALRGLVLEGEESEAGRGACEECTLKSENPR